jgi:hypothetical protein
VREAPINVLFQLAVIACGRSIISLRSPISRRYLAGTVRSLEDRCDRGHCRVSPLSSNHWADQLAVVLARYEEQQLEVTGWSGRWKPARASPPAVTEPGRESPSWIEAGVLVAVSGVVAYRRVIQDLGWVWVTGSPRCPRWKSRGPRRGSGRVPAACRPARSEPMRSGHACR